jgi:hypothetical protein
VNLKPTLDELKTLLVTYLDDAQTIGVTEVEFDGSWVLMADGKCIAKQPG